MGRARLRSLAVILVLIATCAPTLATPGLASAPSSDNPDLTSFVNPLAGTFGAGFPMVGGHLPFGMIEPGPDTGHPGFQDPLNYDGYAYEDTMIRGFSLTHFDGAGIPIAGDLPFMPTTGAVSSSDPSQYQSPYSHAQETARPGYYSVALPRYGAGVEITATERAAMLRFSFPATSAANVLANAGLSINGSHTASLAVVGDRSLEGWMRSESKPTDGYTVYFSAVFDRPFSATGTWTGATIAPGGRSVTATGAGAYLTFDTTARPGLTMRVGISYVDLDGARNNLAREIPPGRSFEAVRVAAHDTWNRHLHGIEVEGGTAELTRTFYSNLYRAMGQPALFDDIDGRYQGFDRRVHRVRAGEHHYTKLSLWDTYRTQNPLLELVEPQVQHDVLVSMLDDFDQNREAIPKWTDANLDYLIMGGDGGGAEVADGVARGILKGAEAARAYGDLLHQATALHPPVPAREFLDLDVRYGFIPYDIAGFRATAETQEYAITDAAIYQLARRLGSPGDAATLRRRADQWKALMDPSGFIRPRNRDGTWADPTNLGSLSMGNLPSDGPFHSWTPYSQDGYQEATGWQQTFEEPQDVLGLGNAIGGASAMTQRLDTFFAQDLADAPYAVPVTQQYTSFFGVYYIGPEFTPANEPDLWTPWYYAWFGQPWKTQKVVRAAMQTYSSRPDGLPGNDDTGTMSAWYVLAAAGLYAVTPGVPVFEVNSPSFPVTRVHLGNGRVFTENAPGASLTNRYIQSASLRGATFERTYLTQCEVNAGGALDYRLGTLPSMTWATAPAAAPPALSDPARRPPVESCSDQVIGRSASDVATPGPGAPTGGGRPPGWPDTAVAPLPPGAGGALAAALAGALLGAARRRRHRPAAKRT
jgi:predicted alpha-1,2-mannosidase